MRSPAVNDLDLPWLYGQPIVPAKEVDMKKLLTVPTLIFAIAGTAAAQTPEFRMPSSGGLVVVFPGQGGGTGPAVFASVDLVCGGSTYTVSTGNGNKGAECKTGGNGNNAICDDGQGNGAEVNCSSGCSSSKGSGSCKVKQ
jgi:hypothetical protein